MARAAAGWIYVPNAEAADAVASRSAGESVRFDVTDANLVAGDKAWPEVTLRQDVEATVAEAVADGGHLVIAINRRGEPTQTVITTFDDGAYAFMAACTRAASAHLRIFFIESVIDRPSDYLIAALDPSSAEFAAIEKWITEQ